MADKKLGRLICRGVVDVVIVIVIGAFFLYKKLAGKPNIRGFFCDDETISYPYGADTVSWGACLAIGVVLTAVVVFASELAKALRGPDGKWSLFGERMFLYSLPFIAGALFEHTFVEIAKFQVGRLRPNFLDACHPTFLVDGVVSTCANSTGDGAAPFRRHVSRYECERLDLKSSMLSFPSGHTSFIFFCMVYLAGYLQIRVTKRLLSFLLRPFLQISFLWLAWRRHRDFRRSRRSLLRHSVDKDFGGDVPGRLGRHWPQSLTRGRIAGELCERPNLLRDAVSNAQKLWQPKETKKKTI